MIDPWDTMISGDDEEVAAEIRADAVAFGKLIAAGDEAGCIVIQQKYSFMGLPPEKISELLAEMGKPSEGGTA